MEWSGLVGFSKKIIIMSSERIAFVEYSLGIFFYD